MLPKCLRTMSSAAIGLSLENPISMKQPAPSQRASLPERFKPRAARRAHPLTRRTLAHFTHGGRRSQHLRLAVYEFLYEPTPRTVAINEALEIARRFSTYEATQFINGILDA